MTDMKVHKWVVIGLFLVAGLCACGDDVDAGREDVGGVWVGQYVFDSMGAPASRGVEMTLRQDGDLLEGEITIEGPWCVTEGTVSGAAREGVFILNLFDPEDTSPIMRCEGTISSEGTLEGSFEGLEYSNCSELDGTLVFHRPEEP